MSNMSTMYVDRTEASRILKVSTRTVDRYLRKYRAKTRRDGRRILIKKEDIDKIIHDHVGHFLDMNIDKSMSTIDRQDVQHLSNIKVSDVRIQKVLDGQSGASREGDDTVYQNLYVQTKGELKEKQERLEAATYRVGQLETQLKNMVPLLDYTRKEKELKEVQDTMEKRVLEANVTLEKTERRLRAERVAKWIYLSLVATLLIAEPILFLFWAFS